MTESQGVIMDQLKSDSTVIYRKKDSDIARSGLAAMVEYDDDAGLSHKRLPTGLNRVLVTLYNDVTTGISLNDDGPVVGDSIWVAPAAGVDAKWCTIKKRIKANHNLATWEVR